MARVKKASKPKTLADRMVEEFKLVTIMDYILFLDSSLMKNEEFIQFAEKYNPEELDGFVHTKSFMRNPLRYMPQLISQRKATKTVKASNFEKINEIVKQAMVEDPLSTVKAIVYSLARQVKF